MSNQDVELKVGRALDNSYVRLGTVVVVVLFFIGAAVSFGEMRAGFDNAVGKIDRIARELDATVDQQKDILRDIPAIKKDVEALNNKIVGRGPGGWHRADMKQWCRETELANGDWRCGATTYDGPPP